MLRQIKIVAAIAFATALLLSQISCSFLSSAQVAVVGHRTDAEMIQLFERNEADFKKLVQMLQQETVEWGIRVNDPLLGTRFIVYAQNERGGPVHRPPTEQELSKDRQREYLELINKLRLTSFARFEGPTGSEIYLQATHRQTARAHSNEKGYAFVPGGKPDDLRDSLDKYNDDTAIYGDPIPVHRAIKNNWYLYFQMN